MTVLLWRNRRGRTNDVRTERQWLIFRGERKVQSWLSNPDVGATCWGGWSHNVKLYRGNLWDKEEAHRGSMFEDDDFYQAGKEKVACENGRVKSL